MNERELLEVVQMKTLTDEDGTKFVLSMPLVLSITSNQKAWFTNKEQLAVKCPDLSNHILAIIDKPEIFEYRKEEICARVFGTTTDKHKKIQKIKNDKKDFLISGASMRFLRNVEFDDGMDQYRLSPAQISGLIKEKNGDGAIIYQINQPLNRGHLLLFEDAKQQMRDKGFRNPILILHPCGGVDAEENVSLEYRIRQYLAFIEDSGLDAILALWPSPYYRAGPVEALWQVSSRVNCGATHFLLDENQCGLLHPSNDKIELYNPKHSEMLVTMLKDETHMDIILAKPIAFQKQRAQMEFYNPEKPRKDYEWLNEPRTLRNLATDHFNELSIMNQDCWDILKEYYKTQSSSSRY